MCWKLYKFSLIPCYEKAGLAQDRARAQTKSGVAQVGFPFRFGIVKPISKGTYLSPNRVGADRSRTP